MFLLLCCCSFSDLSSPALIHTAEQSRKGEIEQWRRMKTKFVTFLSSLYSTCSTCSHSFDDKHVTADREKKGEEGWLRYLFIAIGVRADDDGEENVKLFKFVFGEFNKLIQSFLIKINQDVRRCESENIWRFFFYFSKSSVMRCTRPESEVEVKYIAQNAKWNRVDNATRLTWAARNWDG